jgi:hypothetical protein
MKYDLIVFGGGTSGVAAAYIAAKKGIKTLLVEKTDVLGGSITQSLVIPCMKVDSNGINMEFFNDLKTFANKYNARHKYIDGNEAWFNPELLKIVLDDMLESVNCNVLFSTNPIKIDYDSVLEEFNCLLSHKTLSLYIDTKYIVDSTANGEIFKILNCDFQENSENFQTPTLRFIMSNINIEKFASWIEKIDIDRNVTTVEYSDEQIYLSTACTWDKNKKWALSPLFEQAVENNTLEYEDTAYFQLFSIAGMPNSLAFNCPRIIIDSDESLCDPFVYSRALKQGRKRIVRLSNFLIKYFIGFENSYISHISDMLGVRESYRVKGKYTITKEDLINNKKFENIAFCSNYPIDVHSNSDKNDKLCFINNTYSVPIEALISNNYDNLYCAGRIISADFEAQAALRTQINCFSMGEAVAKDILKKFTRN